VCVCVCVAQRTTAHNKLPFYPIYAAPWQLIGQTGGAITVAELCCTSQT